MSTTFAQLGVPDSICRALERNGIHKPFDIQAASIADSLDGRDICGRAPTGSGKTLAFGIPLVANASQAKAKRPRALILSPTRELADQIAEELRTFAGQIRVGVVYGGVSYGNQVKRLRQGVDILVACPGRLEDLIGQNAVNLCEVDQVVIDEADRMADMGFLPAVRRILDQVAARPQTLLFSATLDGDVAKLTRDYQSNPATHEIGDTTPDVTAADHRFPDSGQGRADRRLCGCDSRHRVDDLVLSHPARIGPAGPPALPTRNQRGCDSRGPCPESAVAHPPAVLSTGGLKPSWRPMLPLGAST